MSGREYWDKYARSYRGSMRLLGGPLPRMLDLASEAVRGSRRFAVRSLRERLEAAGLRLLRDETIAGPIPIAYAEGFEAALPRERIEP